jgi:hypothetical protein
MIFMESYHLPNGMHLEIVPLGSGIEKITLLSNAYERINSKECSSKDLKPDDIKLIFPSLSDLNDNILFEAISCARSHGKYELETKYVDMVLRDNNRVELDALLNNCISAIDQGKVIVYGNKVYKDFTDLSEFKKNLEGWFLKFSQ